jgi:hypothetical protein
MEVSAEDVADAAKVTPMEKVVPGAKNALINKIASGAKVAPVDKVAPGAKKGPVELLVLLPAQRSSRCKEGSRGEGGYRCKECFRQWRTWQ